MEDTKDSSPKLLRLRAVTNRTGLSKSTIYALMKTGAFPLPVHLGRRLVRWVATEIDAWILARAARRGLDV